MKEEKINDYTEEDLETDLAWFNELGIDETKARSYIDFMLNSRWKE